MDNTKPRIPFSAILIDMIGTLLAVAGALQLTGMQLPLLDLLPGNGGWPLIVVGGALMLGGSLMMIAPLLAKHSEQPQSPTVDRGSR